jgi:hypothetical protein
LQIHEGTVREVYRREGWREGTGEEEERGERRKGGGAGKDAPAQ